MKRVLKEVYLAAIIVGGLALWGWGVNTLWTKGFCGFFSCQSSYAESSSILETSAAEPIILEPAGLTRERVERIKATIEKLKQETLLLEQEVTQ